MAKRKRVSASELPLMPQVGDKVYPPNSQMVYEISHVHVGGDEVDLHVPSVANPIRRSHSRALAPRVAAPLEPTLHAPSEEPP